VKGATITTPAAKRRTSRFNPRAREGRDQPDEGVAHGDVVSIHAPVKGATSMGNGYRATVGFNPRAREGRDVLLCQR